MEPVIDTQDRSNKWAIENARNEVPNLDKLAIITNQTTQNIHDIMHNEGFTPDMLALHWLPENSTDFNNKSENERKKIQKDYRYVVNSYIYDSGKYLFLSYRMNHTFIRGSMCHAVFSKSWFYLQIIQSSMRRRERPNGKIAVCSHSSARSKNSNYCIFCPSEFSLTVTD